MMRVAKRQERELEDLGRAQKDLALKLAELEAEKAGPGLSEVCVQVVGRLRNLLFFGMREE